MQRAYRIHTVHFFKKCTTGLMSKHSKKSGCRFSMVKSFLFQKNVSETFDKNQGVVFLRSQLFYIRRIPARLLIKIRLLFFYGQNFFTSKEYLWDFWQKSACCFSMVRSFISEECLWDFWQKSGCHFSMVRVFLFQKNVGETSDKNQAIIFLWSEVFFFRRMSVRLLTKIWLSFLCESKV